MIYIKNMENIKEVASNKFVLWFKCIFNRITVKNMGDKRIYILPWKEEKNLNISDKKINRILNKIKSKDMEEKFVVLSKSLQKEQRVEKILYKNYFKLLDGRWLFNILLKRIVNFIAKDNKMELREKTVAMLINNPNDITMENIKEISKQVKELRIITKNGIFFRRIEQKLYSELGIPIAIVNNRRKSLLKSDIILNIDFEEKEINQYSINKQAIVINIYNEINSVSKDFRGRIYNWYKIKINEEYIDLFKEYGIFNQFDLNVLYESLIYSRDKINGILGKIEKDKVQINELV